jgi:hypothetical protein
MPYYTFFNNAQSNHQYLLAEKYGDSTKWFELFKLATCHAQITSVADTYNDDDFDLVKIQIYGLGNGVDLYRKKNFAIEEAFEKCITHLMSHYFNPYDDDPEAWYVINIFVFVLSLIGSGLLIAIAAEEIYRRYHPAQQQQPRQVIGAIVRPALYFRNRLEILIYQQLGLIADTRPFTLRLAKLLQQNISLHVPETLRCPLGKDIMNDPVTASTGITYDRAELAKEFERQGNPESIKCVVKTDLEIKKEEHQSFSTNLRIKGKIKTFIEKAEALLGNSDAQIHSATHSIQITNYSTFVNRRIVNQDRLPTERIALLAEIPNFDTEAPDEIISPISTGVMDDPITLTTGITYDRYEVRTLLGTNNSAQCCITMKTVYANEADFETNATIEKWTDEYISHLEEKAEEHKRMLRQNVRVTTIFNFKWTRSIMSYFFRRDYVATMNCEEEMMCIPKRRNSGG